MASTLKREEWDFSGLHSDELIPAVLWEVRRERRDVDDIDRMTQAWLAGKLSTKRPPTARNKRTGKRPRYNTNFSEADTARVRATRGFDAFIPYGEFIWRDGSRRERGMEYDRWVASHIRPLLKNRNQPWQCLPKEERRRICDIYERFRNANVVRIGAWWDAVAHYGKDKPDRGEPLRFDFGDYTSVLLTVNWSFSKKRILAAFAELLGQLQPVGTSHIKRWDRRGKKNRDLLVRLERLAIMRLLHQFTLLEIKLRLPDAWKLYGHRKWYDERRQALRDFWELMHRRDAEEYFPKSWETKAQRSRGVAQPPAKSHPV